MTAASLACTTDRHTSAAAIGWRARQALTMEVETWPKPGLVSHVDRGSHNDMDAALLIASAETLEPWFSELAAAGASGAGMDLLRDIGRAAERAMLDVTHGVNTHRGAIFGLGLLAAAAGFKERFRIDLGLGKIIAARWGHAILDGPVDARSHGSIVARRYGGNGARAEAAGGMQSVYSVALPALAQARRRSDGNENAARVHTCMALIASVRDSNLLFRGGPEGLALAQSLARGFLANGGVGRQDWQADAEAIHARFVAENLSPGGCADLLAMAIFVDGLSA
jgi:triphosphoribosyl-dephospho-CoA synthase